MCKVAMSFATRREWPVGIGLARKNLCVVFVERVDCSDENCDVCDAGHEVVLGNIKESQM